MPLVFEDEDGNVHESLHAVFEELPLFRHFYLNMQGQNIALTDIDLREMEVALLREYMVRERTPSMSALRVSAWSQMWVFAFYELLRTWRQRAREIKVYADNLRNSSDPDKVKADFRANFEKVSQLSRTGGFDRQIFEGAEVSPSGTFGQIERAMEIVEPFFRRLEAVRMTLAKHEVPKAHGMLATAPGYSRIDLSDGSIYWMIDYKDGTSKIISRRGLAEEFESLLPLLRIDDRK